MLYTHEEVLAQLKIIMATHRDMRVSKVQVRAAQGLFGGYRAYNLAERTVVGAEIHDYYLMVDGYRHRLWLRIDADW